ncbi:MAG: hypothetical protein R3C19_12210 [Planctomycetaceae bacterium]
MHHVLPLFAQAAAGAAAAGEQDTDNGAAVIGFLVIVGILIAIFNSGNKKKTFDIRGTAHER